MEAEKTYWPIEKLTNWDKNPRSINNKDFERLKKQIELLGEYKPLIVTGGGVVLGGNMRLRAYREMGWKQVWVSVVEAETDQEKLEFALSDNDRAGEYNEAQLAELALNVPEIDLGLFHVDLGASMSLKELASRFGPDIVEDETPALDEGEAVSKTGEIYQLGRHRVMCGDSTVMANFEKLMDGKTASMVFTDPPYNVGYAGGMNYKGENDRKKMANDKMSSEEFYTFLLTVMENLVRVVDGAFYVCMSSSELHNLWKAFTDAGGHWQTYIIWAKDSFTLGRSDYQHQFEPIMYGLGEKAVQEAINEVDEDKLPIMYGWTRHKWYGGRKQGDVWRFERPKVSKEHPTMKPVALGGRAIVNSSMRDEIIVDAFLGSGSTLMACEQTDRICYGLELDPHYVDVIRKRYANFIHRGDAWEAATPKL